MARGFHISSAALHARNRAATACLYETPRTLQCKFPAGFFHPNIYPSGTVCLSILNEVRQLQSTLSAAPLSLGMLQERCGCVHSQP